MFAAGDYGCALVAADFDEDGSLDLAAANRYGDDVTVLRNDAGLSGIDEAVPTATSLGRNVPNPSTRPRASTTRWPAPAGSGSRSTTRGAGRWSCWWTSTRTPAGARSGGTDASRRRTQPHGERHLLLRAWRPGTPGRWKDGPGQVTGADCRFGPARASGRWPGTRWSGCRAPCAGSRLASLRPPMQGGQEPPHPPPVGPGEEGGPGTGARRLCTMDLPLYPANDRI